MKLNRRHVIASGMFSLMAGPIGPFFSSAAHAQSNYPSRPIRLVVPFAPGGAVDIYARTVQPELQRLLGQPVLVDNRAGASGMIGMETVAKSAADGYTLAVGNIATFSINPGIYEKMSYDPLNDLTPIYRTVAVNYVLVVNPQKVPVKSIRELIPYLRANPGKISYGSSGAGSAQHMAAELFKFRTKTDMVHIPYKGTGAVIGDLIGGHVDLIFADRGSVMPQVKAGKLKLLGVCGTQRDPDYPDVPTVAEGANLPDFEMIAWQGIAGPANLPAEIVLKLSDAFGRAQAEPAVVKSLATNGMDVYGASPKLFGTYIRSEIDRWAAVARNASITAKN